MTIYKGWYATLNLVGLLSSTLLAKDSFHYSLSPQTIQPGNHAVLYMSVPLETDDNESNVTINDGYLFEDKSLQILEKTSERTNCCLEIKYELTAYKTNTYRLPPLEIKTRNNSFSTELKTLTVQTARSPQDDALRESFSTVSTPLPLLKWLKRLGSLLLISLCVRYFWKKLTQYKPKRKTPTIPLPTPPQEDPLSWLERQLSLLKIRLKEDPTNQQLIDDWSQIIREYFEKVSSLPALCWTTRELKTKLKDKAQFIKLIPCFEDSDSFKFQPDYKTKTTVSRLVNHFIRETETHILLCGS